MATNTVKHLRGADLHLVLTLKSGGTPVNLTGFSAIPFEVKPAELLNSFVFTITDAVNGIVSISCPWSDFWPKGIGTTVEFRGKFSNGWAIPLITLVLA
jgi:hypothetical protein